MRLLRWLRALVPTDDRQMSQAWWKDRGRLESRVEFHGPALTWPIQKLANDAARWNRQRLRRSA